MKKKILMILLGSTFILSACSSNIKTENIKETTVNVETGVVEETDTPETEKLEIKEIGVIDKIEDNQIFATLEDGVEVIAQISEDTKLDSNLAPSDKVNIIHNGIMTRSYPGMFTTVYEISKIE